jgi:uncharacterized protein YigE (DUF2233 family)
MPLRGLRTPILANKVLQSENVSRGHIGIAAFAIILMIPALWLIFSRPGTIRTAASSSCTQQIFEGSRFTVCRYDPARQDMRLMLSDKQGKMLKDFQALAGTLGQDANRVSFAMNAGMYALDSQPIGLYIEESKQRYTVNTRNAAGNFYTKPNGIFWADDAGLHISTTNAFLSANPQNIRFASQSGPMLVMDGQLHPKFQQDGESRKTRNGVGLTAENQAFFIISEDPVSFGKFARFFRDVLKCPNALYFDGTVSALWDGPKGGMSQPFPLGPFVVVMDKPAKAN